jgi:transcriptional regulator with XRE-family HTH domain
MGRAIRRRRQARRMTQRQLARRAGVTQGRVAQLESGRSTSTTVRTLRALARALGVPVGELLK